MTPVCEDGVARMYWLAFVCALGLMAGGVAALALYHGRQSAAEVRGVAAQRPDAGRDAGAGVAGGEGSAAEDAPTGGVEASAADAAADEVEGGAVVSSAQTGGRRAGVRLRAGSSERAGGDARSARRDARAPGRQAAGGRGLGGHALGGVKKTGEGVKKTGVAIGRTVGKIGGIFHD